MGLLSWFGIKKKEEDASVIKGDVGAKIKQKLHAVHMSLKGNWINVEKIEKIYLSHLVKVKKNLKKLSKADIDEIGAQKQLINAALKEAKKKKKDFIEQAKKSA